MILMPTFRPRCLISTTSTGLYQTARMTNKFKTSSRRHDLTAELFSTRLQPVSIFHQLGFLFCAISHHPARFATVGPHTNFLHLANCVICQFTVKYVQAYCRRLAWALSSLSVGSRSLSRSCCARRSH